MISNLIGRLRDRRRSRGQILVLFAMSMMVMTGMVAVVIDVSWYWTNSLKIQRAADAAALAGVVQLPANPSTAYALARAEAAKNGYDDAATEVVLTPQQFPPVTGRRLDVTLSAPVNTFFMRVFGITSIQATRTAKAEYVLPVPMGSPENYYGVFGLVRGRTNTATTTVTNVTPSTGDSGFRVPTAQHAPIPVVWSPSGGNMVSAVGTEDTTYARTLLHGSVHSWGAFGLESQVAANQAMTSVTGIEVRLADAFLSTGSCPTTRVAVHLSWNGGASWTTTTTETPSLGISTTAGDYTLGAPNSLAAWGGHTWVPADLRDGAFRVRLTAVKSLAPACLTTELRVDRLEVRATYQQNTTTQTTQTTTTTLPDENLRGPGTACPLSIASCYQPDGAALNPRGFWATMNTQGSANVNGDAHQPYYDTVGSTTNPNHDGTNYYSYAFEMPAGSSAGSIYVFDPNFCTTSINRGVADRWFSGSNGVSSWYRVFDTKGTINDPSDDGNPVASSGSLFTGMDASDTSMGGGGGGAQCRNTTDSAYGDARDYHNRWYLLASGLAGGKTYRIHTSSRDPASALAQIGTDGANSYALYGSASGGTPKIYGIGAMQAFTPLSANGSEVSSEFYLAQLDAVHAGKTVQISLWDPGDTNPLEANLEILRPNSGGWSATPVSYTAEKGTTNSGAANCNALTGSGVTSIKTNVGATAGTYNGCWLKILASIPSNYTAEQNGWWKIRYRMDGTGTSNDVTTWKVEILGNPVHLIIP